MADGHIVLVGLTGSGKSTVGRRLAERLERRFVDTDDAVEALAGSSVREIFAERGEPEFRDLEHRVLADALVDPRPSVIAAAGGAVVRRENRELLKNSQRVVWLRADNELLLARVSRLRAHRPLLDDDPAGRLAAMSDTREPLYREVATLDIDVSDKSVDDICVEIEGRLV